MKILTLNLFRGKCLDAVCHFLNENEFDIVQMQEVSGGPLSFDGVDCFGEVMSRTGMMGDLLTSWKLRGEEKGYFANATFHHPERVRLQERFDLRLQPIEEYEALISASPTEHPRTALFLRFEQSGKSFWTINTHLAWGPTPYDAPYKLANTERLAAKLATLDRPFVLTGDFNVVQETQTIQVLEPHARNLTREYGLTNTLNPHLHRAKQLFPPGLAVDYIFVSPHVHVTHFRLLNNIDLSDHLGLVADLDF